MNPSTQAGVVGNFLLLELTVNNVPDAAAFQWQHSSTGFNMVKSTILHHDMQPLAATAIFCI